jgi:hypothetical protein
MGLFDDDRSRGIWGKGKDSGGGLFGKRGASGKGIWDKSNTRDGRGMFSEAARSAFGGEHASGMWNPINPWNKKVKSGW